jgi:hypothetical protein
MRSKCASSTVEDIGHIGDEFELLVVNHPVRLGDVEQAVEHILEHGAIGLARAAHARHPLCIGLVAGDILLGEIVKPRHIAGLGLRDREYLLEGAHLFGRHDAVGLGHLRRQRDHSHRKCHLAPGFRIAGKHRAHGFDHAGKGGGGGFANGVEKAAEQRHETFLRDFGLKNRVWRNAQYETMHFTRRSDSSPEFVGPAPDRPVMPLP